MAEFEGVVFLLYNTARRQASAGHSTISNLIPLKLWDLNDQTLSYVVIVKISHEIPV